MTEREQLKEEMNVLLRSGFILSGHMEVESRTKDRLPILDAREIDSFRKGFMEELGRQSARDLIAFLRPSGKVSSTVTSYGDPAVVDRVLESITSSSQDQKVE